MDEISWRQQTTERLRNLAHTIESWSPNLLYGAVTGCAILPLVAATQQGQLPYDALYGVLGGAGLNLVSNLIQQCNSAGGGRSSAAGLPPAQGPVPALCARTRPRTEAKEKNGAGWSGLHTAGAALNRGRTATRLP